MPKVRSKKKAAVVMPLLMSERQRQQVRQWHAEGFDATLAKYKDHVLRAWQELGQAIDLCPLLSMHMDALNHHLKERKKCRRNSQPR